MRRCGGEDESEICHTPHRCARKQNDDNLHSREKEGEYEDATQGGSQTLEVQDEIIRCEGEGSRKSFEAAITIPTDVSGADDCCDANNECNDDEVEEGEEGLLGSNMTPQSSAFDSAILDDDDVTLHPVRATRAPVREHSYLPGTSHPLPWHTSRTTTTRSDNHGIFMTTDKQTMELAVLELPPGAVLFPGSSIPLRLRNPDWVRYLQMKIDDQSSSSASDFRQEIRHHQRSSSDGRNSRAVTGSSSSPSRDASSPLSATKNLTRRYPGKHCAADGCIAIGILPTRHEELLDLSEVRRVNNNTIRTASLAAGGEQQIQSRNGSSAISLPTSVSSNRAGEGVIGRVGTVAVLTTISRRCTADAYEYGDDAAAVEAGEDDEENDTEIYDNGHGSDRLVANHFNRQQGDDNEINSGRLVQQESRRRSRRRRRAREVFPQEIIATAIGTSRFRVTSFTADYDCPPSSPGTIRRRSGWGDMADKHMYIVQMLNDGDMSKPPSSCHLVAYNNYADIHDKRGDRFGGYTRMLAMVSPIPRFAWDHVWPWRLAQQIRDAVAYSPTWSGLRYSLPSDDYMGPNAFSFWMSSNLPLTESDRIDLLEMQCLVSRLRFILQKVNGQNDTPICCNQCGSTVSHIGHMFTVEGAEGTAGNYVNEHGFIHQTITVRSVETDNILLIGEAQDKDSWFPGYTWTMAYCNGCYSHIGWKFQPLPVEEESCGGYDDVVEFPASSRSLRRRRLLSRGEMERFFSEGSSPQRNEESDHVTRNISESTNGEQEGGNHQMSQFWGLTAASVSEGSGESVWSQRSGNSTSLLRRIIASLSHHRSES